MGFRDPNKRAYFKQTGTGGTLSQSSSSSRGSLDSQGRRKQKLSQPIVKKGNKKCAC